MLKLPDLNKMFEYENNFYWSCTADRIAKIIAHYELYKTAAKMPGAIVECGVFKGASLIRFAIFEKLFGRSPGRRIIAFDTFDKLPRTSYVPDKRELKRYKSIAGEDCISRDQLYGMLERKRIGRSVELVEGDILKTVPAYVKTHPELRISLLNLDVDIYKPSVTILKWLYPRIVKGGLLLLDDYGVYNGETRAADEYFRNTDIKIRKFPFCVTPCYIKKKE